MLHRQEHGADDEAPQLQYSELKRTFEADEPSKSGFMKFALVHLHNLCREYKIPPFDSDESDIISFKKIEMVRRLILWRQEHRDSSIRANPGSTPRHVIGKDLLAEIWADMGRTILPTWIQAPPPKWGTIAAGKLSADEYKVICSISLVVTLIRVWGYENAEGVESRRFKMLQNYVDLVHAIHVLFLRETSQKSRAYYKSHMLRYLRTVLDLYPDITLKSNHHLAIHIITDLENLGPGHAVDPF
ncbi:hypothetical protein LENED_009240 [Lentinula edodes]|uniref:Uncharacterized protein n=1 Tax=Lentinula edodes TaxID=5353 RepID=A0A1Q3EJ90_LENED|nr:hypothetical protein LENED_009240 [Lentinula edodes]